MVEVLERTIRAPRLIAAKTRIPQAPPALVTRPRLLSALRAGLQRKLVVVIAPAGFGKTTLVAEMAREVDAAAWLALDSSDQDLAVFTHYLIAAVAQVRPGFGAELREWLAATPAPALQIEDCGAILLQELEATGPAPLVLFLDDFHVVSGSDSIIRLLDSVLRYLPLHVHLVLSTRVAPPLTNTRLVVQQQLSGLGTADLRFTVDEAENWLTLRADGRESRAVRQLVESTEGWVTGMLLQSAAAVPPQLGVPSDQLYDYLTTEVIEHQPLPVQRFLERAAILSHLTLPLCEEVLEAEDAAGTLRWIHEQQLFLAAVGTPDAPSYRLHQLFREFLVQRLRDRDPAEFTRLQRRAAAYFEQQGDCGEAMQHLFAAADWEQAVGLAARTGRVEIEAGHVERVEGWLARFTAALREPQLDLLVLEARLLLTQAQYPRAAEALNQAEYLVLETGDRAGHAEVLGLRARLSAARNDGQQMVDLARQALAISEATPPTRAHAYHAAAIGYANMADGTRADAAFEAALKAYIALGDGPGSAWVSADWGYALALREELGRAVDHLERALDHAHRTSNSRLLAVVRTNLAQVYQSRGDLRRADEELAAAGEIAQRLRWWRVALTILLDRAENLLELEGPHAALRLYEESEELARRATPIARIGILAGQARCLRHLGRYADAWRLAREGLDAAVAGAMAFEAAECRLELGAARLAQVPDEALPLLRDAETALTTLGRKRAAARAAAVLATALFAATDYDAARAALDRAYALAAGSGQYLAPEFAVISGLPLLRLAARNDGRYAGWLEAVQRYLDTEHQEDAPDTPDAGTPLHLVRGRPRLLEVYSLGQASVYRDGTALTRAEWQTTTAKELFFYFVEHPEGGRKETILAALWPDQSQTRANDNFHTSLRRLRNALGMEMVKTEDGIYRLSPTLALWHDGAEALRLIERARQTGVPDEARRWWTGAADLLQGPFADEFYRDWAGARRQFWETRTREVLGWLADDALRQQAFEAAAGWAQRLLALDSLDESAHALLMRIHAAAGNMIMLDQQYNELCRVVQLELGGAPSAEIRALYQRLREPVGAQRKLS